MLTGENFKGKGSETFWLECSHVCKHKGYEQKLVESQSVLPGRPVGLYSVEKPLETFKYE